MDNYTIADNFSLLAKLMDIHGDNSFKAKSYSSAAYNIEKLNIQLNTIDEEKILSLKGIGESVGKKIIEQLQTGQLSSLNEYLEKTPQGIIEMLLHIKGLGPKKIATIWKDLEIETIGELLYACNENRLTLYKGFGEKTQNNIKESIEFYLSNMGNYLYEQIETYTIALDEKLKTIFKEFSFYITSAFKRQLETIDKLEWVTNCSTTNFKNFFLQNEYQLITETTNYISFKGKENIELGFYCCSNENLIATLFKTSCSEEFYNEWVKHTNWNENTFYKTEEEIFSIYNIEFVPAFLREKSFILEQAKNKSLPTVIQPEDIKAIIHSHSNWSDGSNTIEEMANECITRGLQYLVISDHSKAAYYAKGLTEDRIVAQHELIETLNKQLYPFKIFKSIECDILNDGNLDYTPAILKTFDIIIASVHSNLKMNEEKAMMRLLKAIENPFTAILGHMTGRLLLSRNGYPINHKIIIDACAANNVVIELNAHPRRLDIDWRWIDYALMKNVLISIDPDAHNLDGFNDCKYGILAAQKAGLTKQQNLSSFSLTEFEKFVETQQAKRNKL
ncbi:MAG: DNA polymerase/3'-5' exonuclease PolX [Bacteroidetes bacterium]|nr:DNA polymerase/3'-5' exonuclease PolX [Bacteroidota bacterium]MBS1648159.1 DNA polymerase/3'-5' exonuclease PolX [Bacteroidota bacterium]